MSRAIPRWTPREANAGSKKTITGKYEVKLEPSGKPLEPRSLLTGDGIYWMLSSMLLNFTRNLRSGWCSSRFSGSGSLRSSGFSARSCGRSLSQHPNGY